jgi:glutathione peroxidase
MTPTINEFTLPSLTGGTLRLADYAGQVMLLVNTASECGFTPQYAGLEALWRAYRERGFVVLGFPCNQFGHQEPGDAAEIGQFCSKNYGVSFPMSVKIEVNGAQAHPLYQYLTRSAPGLLGTEAIKWNFTKFLVARNGEVVARYAPTTKPADLTAEIERLLSIPPVEV